MTARRLPVPQAEDFTPSHPEILRLAEALGRLSARRQIAAESAARAEGTSDAMAQPHAARSN